MGGWECDQQKSLLCTLLRASPLHWGLCSPSPGYSLKIRENIPTLRSRLQNSHGIPEGQNCIWELQDSGGCGSTVSYVLSFTLSIPITPPALPKLLSQCLFMLLEVQTMPGFAGLGFSAPSSRTTAWERTQLCSVGRGPSCMALFWGLAAMLSYAGWAGLGSWAPSLFICTEKSPEFDYLLEQRQILLTRG